MSEVTPEAPATDAPGATIFVCPACGTRYDEPTTCSNGHEPTETVEYDRATLEAAAGGDETAQAAIADATAAAGVGSTAGVSTASPEAVPPSFDPPAPVAAEPVAETPAEPAAETPAEPVVDAEPVPAAPDTAAIFAEIETAIENVAAAVRAAKTALGL